MIFEVDRQDIRTTQVVDAAPTALEPGQVRLGVERFAFTSNNISYAIAGDSLGYWGFFPTDTPWGRIPAIGIGSVVESANPDTEVGGRYFGFYPMADEHVVSAERRGEHGFRAPLPGAKPEFFFAPGQRAKRVEDWGAAELDARIDRVYRGLVDHSGDWLRVHHRHGPAGIDATYRQLLDGSADPAAGFICTPQPEEGTS